jgi:hypothetical protein
MVALELTHLTSQDFVRRYPANYVLSITNESLIIGNKSSHDVRQYSAECDPEYKDNATAAGMAYMHLVVIPKQKGTCLNEN